MHIHPLRLDVHIDKEPQSGSTFPTALEGSLDVFLPAMATKRQSDPGEDDILTPSRGIEVSE
jgi:hypothetical protein